MPLEDVLDEALEALTTHTLIQWKGEQGGYSMHKLVHAWGFDRLEAEEQGTVQLEQSRMLDTGRAGRATQSSREKSNHAAHLVKRGTTAGMAQDVTTGAEEQS